MLRSFNRRYDEIRPITITRNYVKYSEGSVFIEMGDNKVICTASVEEKVPLFLRGTQQGWITAEYAMIPRANQFRNIRDSVKGKINGRAQEIQRLVGRSLRAITDLEVLGPRMIWIDCDVIQADGGTRTTSIIGAFIALIDALRYLKAEKKIERIPIKQFLGAISVGIVEGEMLLDLEYKEDSNAQVDMNVIMTERNELVEIQGTAEKKPFSKRNMYQLMELAENGINQVIEKEKEIVGEL
ncbi:MAG: ribonuclease PH [Candidatus Caldatribacteriota bacterium]|jgi:ribonuclease PH|nr:ribonuclease PH [Atribacterota bacterium]MDD3031567.1 ribonuclease PH [Atribacterota bacterium]MDD4288736.1 ribonuclease PH [Atribacterota bacterium]MDD4764694.1 ribonuclease PH [Atribacterota bacterium]MDD5635979.1 ribonuclease PH [Atribacterota bacterium]